MEKLFDLSYKLHDELLKSKEYKNLKEKEHLMLSDSSLISLWISSRRTAIVSSIFLLLFSPLSGYPNNYAKCNILYTNAFSTQYIDT